MPNHGVHSVYIHAYAHAHAHKYNLIDSHWKSGKSAEQKQNYRKCVYVCV